jgi:uncharacterized protein YdaU (DUF1376 family)
MGNKVYMPLVHGDWLKGTQGMRAEVRGVYLNLLLFQWNNGYLPADWEDLCLIDPELPKVWEKLKPKFTETAPGQLQNKNLEDIRAFWAKQKNNGKKGGRKPKDEPKSNPKDNPNHNHHNDIDLDNDTVLKNNKESETFEYTIEPDVDLKLAESLDERYLDEQAIKWPHLDFQFEYRTFCEKVRGSPEHYRNHDNGGIRLAFQKQLRESKNKKNGKGFSNKNDRTEFTSRELEIIKAHVDRNKR